MRRHHILIPLAALLIVLPLLTNGCSCGHDFEFHLQSWLDAAEQFRHGTIAPHWAFSAAYNAGEPRFIFYPPLSWTLGALLTMVFPVALVTTAYTCIALVVAGFAMNRLARHFAPANAALIAAFLYMAGPYMLFTAFERTAYAELLAAAWLPLLFLAVLRERPTIHGIALPVALLWLTNAPAAVMGCYTLVVIISVRLAIESRSEDSSSPSRLQLLLTTIAGASLGLALSSVYLLPAAYERRFVQIAMAIIPNMRFQDNFLFGHTDDVPHNAVLHTASLLAIELLIATAVALAAMYLQSRNKKPTLIFAAATALTLIIAFLLTPVSTLLWNHVPELAFLQFPWRLLMVLSVVPALTVALLFGPFKSRAVSTMPLAFVSVVALAFVAIHIFRQGCADEDRPQSRAALFQAHHGVEPTDEYTPNDADNDVLRADNPPFWLSPNPAAFAANTTPNPASLLSGAPLPQALASGIATTTSGVFATAVPFSFAFAAPGPEFLIVNLRSYPNWDVTVDDPNSLERFHPAQIARDDGLIAVRLDNGGTYRLNIAWRRTSDQWAGLAITFFALLLYILLTLFSRSRRIKP